MTIYCHITAGLVDNRAVFDDTMPDNWPDRAAWVADETAQIGWAYAGGVFTAPSPAAPVAPSTNPDDYTLTKRQVCAALILAGVTDDPNGFVLNVLSTIADAQAKALAINDWNYAPYYTRTNALFNDPSLLGASGITAQQIDQFWLLGAQQPA